ncbi:MAG: hypothetical protein AAF478_14455, partial [Pseudomonadota bacterium]
AKQPIIDWHRLFGIAVEQDFIDYIILQIERERDSSVKQEYLDLLIIYTENIESLESFLANPPKPLPDGLDNLSQHNLITYKSMRETLDEWTIFELLRHYVSYRKEESDKARKLAAERKKKKQASIKKDSGNWFNLGKRPDENSDSGDSDKSPKFLPNELFRLYAICTRYPETFIKNYSPTKIQDGVYELMILNLSIRIIVLSRIPKAERNALWNVFSNVEENIVFGAQQFEQMRKEMSSVLDQLFMHYDQEGVHVAYTVEQFNKDYLMNRAPDLLEDESLQTVFFKSIRRFASGDMFLSMFSHDRQLMRDVFEKMLAIFFNDEGLKRYSMNTFLSRLSPDERLDGLSPDEQMQSMLKKMSPEEIKSYLERIEDQ